MELMPITAPKKYLVLSFDGGGVRMVLQNRILARILERYPDLLERVDIFAGTSAGSILASALATGIHPEVSKAMVTKIFKRAMSRKVLCPGGLWRSKYPSKNLRKVLNKIFGETTPFPSGDSPKKLFITSFKTFGDDTLATLDSLSSKKDRPGWLCPRVSRWHPVYYHNVERPSSENETLVNTIMKSTAAPYYFPDINGYIDGGIGNTNPALSVITYLISIGVSIEDIYVLSIGSGENPTALPPPRESRERGALQWAPYILDMMFDASQELVSQQAYEILKDRFWRVQPILGESMALDDVSKYDDLEGIADTFNLKNCFAWVGEVLGKI